MIILRGFAERQHALQVAFIFTDSPSVEDLRQHHLHTLHVNNVPPNRQDVL